MLKAGAEHRTYWRGRHPIRLTDVVALMTRESEILQPDHSAYAEVIEAMRRYHEAQVAGAPATEVERLRQIAEALSQAVTDYQMKAFVRSGGPPH